MDAHKTGPKGLKRPRLTPLDRLQIEAGLQNGESPYSIARRIGHDLKTVLREIRDRARTIKTGVACRLSNKYVHRAGCRKKHVCPKCLHKRERLCRFCNQCNSHCADYREDVCAKLQKSPHVCNGCPSIRKCVLTRRTYDGAEAQKDYERLLSESRKGVNLTEEEVAKFDQLLHDLVKKGQSIHAVMVNNASLFTFCEKSAYRYINGGLLMTKRHHLPRACSIKPRRGDKPVEARVDKACRIGREYSAYVEMLAKNPGIPVTEMDTVEGRRGGKALLTFSFNPTGFMAAFLLEAKTSACVKAAFDLILSRLAELYHGDSGEIFGMYAELFQVILTDLGTEFSDPVHIECPCGASAEGHDGRLVFLYCCDPYSAWQKTHVERGHEFIRYVLPKATPYTEAASFDDLTQEDVNLLMSHINSYPRKALKDRTPYDLFTARVGEDVAEKVFGIRKVSPNDVVLKPSLLGIEVKIKEWVLREDGGK